MTEPLDYRAFANLKAALQAIAQGAGFFYSVDDTAVKLDFDNGVEEMLAPDGPRPCVLIELRQERWEYHGAGEVLHTLPATLHWLHTPAPVSDAVLGEPAVPQDEDRMRMFYRGCADVEKAITADTSRGGLVPDTRITDRRWNPLNGNQEVWAEIDIEMSVYRTYGVPA